MRAYIKKNRSVPPEVIKRFLEIPDRANETKSSIRGKLLGEKCALAQSYVKQYKQGFEFKAQAEEIEPIFELPPGIPGEPSREGSKVEIWERVYSSDKMIEQAFMGLMMNASLDKLLTDKVKMTNFIAREFETYLSSAVFFQEQPISVPSINKRCKIAGCVLLAFEMIVDEVTFNNMVTAKMYYKEHLASSTYHLYTKQAQLLQVKTTKQNS